tara:strand:- start:1176 stop:1640 length:465 start_codon:yes stop_codon:yes gene_type:complete
MPQPLPPVDASKRITEMADLSAPRDMIALIRLAENSPHAFLAAVDKGIVIRSVTPVLDHGTSVDYGGTIAADGIGDVLIGHGKDHPAKIHGDLADMAGGPPCSRCRTERPLAPKMEELGDEFPDDDNLHLTHGAALLGFENADHFRPGSVVRSG